MYYFSICTTYLIHFPILCYINFPNIANHSINFLQLQHNLISHETYCCQTNSIIIQL
jgi:hypothetical protein